MLKFLVLVGYAAALNVRLDESPVSLHSIHQEQLDYADAQVESQCTVRVDTKTKTLYLHSNLGNFTVRDGKVFDKDGIPADMPPKALICTGNPEASSTGPALFFAASGADYLYKSTDQGAPIEFFLNKHCWARNNNIQYYLWLGSPSDTDAMKAKDPTALPCKDGAAGNHYFVIAGMRQLLMEKQNSWIISMDISDTFFTKDFAHKNLLSKFLDDRYDFIGGATAGGSKVFINGAILAYKKGKWATDFAAEWFKNRCGPMNQLGMWASLFKIWQRDDDPSFKYDKKKMSSYLGPKDANGDRTGAHEYARAQSKHLLQGQAQLDAMDMWIETGKLPIALKYPHVLVHANVGAGGVDGTAWRADINRKNEPFVCHNTWDRHKFNSCNAQLSMCALPEQCQCS